MFLRWTPEPSDWHLLQQILVSFLCGEPKWRFFWSVHLELFGNSLTICPSHYSTGHVCYLVRPPGLRNSHNAPFHPVTSYSGNKIKTLSVSFFPLSDSAVKSSCLFHPLFTFIHCVPAAAAQDCDTCHTLFTMTVSDWGCPGKHLTWIWCRKGLSWCSYSHKHFRQVTYGQTTVVFVVLRRSRRFTTTDFHQWRMSHASITRRVLPAVEMPGCSFAHSA